MKPPRTRGTTPRTRGTTPGGPRESQLLRQIEKHFRKHHPDIVVRKRHGGPFTTAGDPDLYGCWQGHHFEIEIKKPGEKPTPLQQNRLVKWGQAGALTGVVRSVDDLITLLTRWSLLDV